MLKDMGSIIKMEILKCNLLDSDRRVDKRMEVEAYGFLQEELRRGLEVCFGDSYFILAKAGFKNVGQARWLYDGCKFGELHRN